MIPLGLKQMNDGIILTKTLEVQIVESLINGFKNNAVLNNLQQKPKTKRIKDSTHNKQAN
jgi:hypothetical protein